MPIRSVPFMLAALCLVACDSAEIVVNSPSEVNSIPEVQAAEGSLSVIGQWSDIIDLPIVPVGAANLPNGKVLFWLSRDRLTWFGTNAPTSRTWTSIFDPATNLTSDRFVTNTGHDMFCPGTTNLADGSLMISGGINSKHTSIYDSRTDTWRREANMNIGRGYQANTMLSSGEVLTLGGSWSGGQGNKHGEIYSAGDGWRRITGLPVTPLLNGINDPLGIHRNDNHAWLWTAPDGKVFHAGPSSNMHWLDTSGNGSFSAAGPRADDTPSLQGTTVMYDIGKLLKAGGAISYTAGHPANRRAYTIDINQPTPVVQRQQDMTSARTMHNSVVLPTGEVVLVGGNINGRRVDADAVLEAEMWDPATGEWTSLAALSKPRHYHSIALLLPDGRIMAAGGGGCGSCPINHPNAEIFSPPYLFDGNQPAVRPIMFGVPETADYGDTIGVQTDGPVSNFSLVRLSSVTHSTNNDQRRIPLQANRVGNNFYDLQIPNNRGVVLPGYYMLFAMNSNGTPSVASIIGIGTEIQTRYDFDFGTESSPVRSEWERITPDTANDVVSWSGVPVAAVDRGNNGNVNEINRDIVYGRGLSTLDLNVGSGVWRVTINMGDSAGQHDNMAVTLEDNIIDDNITTARGEFLYLSSGNSSSSPSSVDVEVADGVLNIGFSDQGGGDPNWIVTRLSLTRIGDIPDEPLPEPPTPTSEENNLLDNGNFSNSLSAWQACGGLSSVTGGVASLSSEGCLFQEFGADAGKEYALRCDASVSADFASIQVSASDINYVPLISDSVPITSSTLTSANARVVAPQGSSYGVVTLYGQTDARFDNCVIEVSGSIDATESPDNRFENVVLLNADFASGTTDWTNCGGNQTIVTDGIGNRNALNLRSAGCAYQEFSVTPGATYALGCTAKSASGYTSITLTSYDNSYNVLSSIEQPIVSNGYTEQTISSFLVETGAAVGSVTLYAESDATFDNCAIMVSSEPPPLEPVQVADNILINGDFSDDSTGWFECGGTHTVQAEGVDNSDALVLNNNGCIYQEFTAEINKRYRLSCQSRATGYASATLGFTNAGYQTIDSNDITVPGSTFSNVLTTVVAPDDSVYGVVTLYADSSAVFDNCAVEKLD